MKRRAYKQTFFTVDQKRFYDSYYLFQLFDNLTIDSSEYRLLIYLVHILFFIFVLLDCINVICFLLLNVVLIVE